MLTLGRSRWFVPILVCIGLLAGCASTRPPAGDRPLRQAEDAPDHFVVGAIDGAGTSEPAPGAGCRNPMVDPRNGTRLTLVRSSEGQGDYEVPPRQYGVGEGEVLRIDCATGRTIGIFKRK